MDENHSRSSSKTFENLCKELAIDIPKNLESAIHDSLCIYSVPPPLRHINNDAYTPLVISIGPMHHGKEQLQDMEMQKLRYFIEFCKRPTKAGKGQNEILKELKGIIEKEKDEIHHCYSMTSKLEKDEMTSKLSPTHEFEKMILLDAIFIFELFLRHHERSKYGKDFRQIERSKYEKELRHDKRSKYGKDFILSKPWLSVAVQLDLILLENQLPFFILEKLYASAVKNFRDDDNPQGKDGLKPHIIYPSFFNLSCRYFSGLQYMPKPEDIKENDKETLHFTDLIRYCWSLSRPEEIPESESIVQNRYNATKLKQAGVKFKKSLDPCLHSIRFGRGWSSKLPGWIKNFASLEMQFPCLEVDDSSERVIRNLMALEQCHYPKEAYICEYIMLLDSLIDTKKDVDLLVDQKIIVNSLGEDAAVAKLVNSLCLGVIETEVSPNYNHISERLNSYYESKWNKNVAYFKSVYFSNVWIGTGTIVGVAVLLLTVANTIRIFAKL